MDHFFQSNLKYLRKRNQQTQSSLAKSIQKGQTTIGNWETGFSEPSLTELMILSKFFGVSVADLLERDLAKGNLIKKEANPEKGNLKGNPIGNLNPQNSTPDTYSVVIEAKDQVIQSLQEAINAQKELLNVKNQQLIEITEENNRLKRAVPEIGQPMEDTSRVGGHSKTA